ncbi:MAG: aminoacyl-tRNA hydrolase [Phycisphaeraceae bacterium]|nr:aminoacyl-tRNA hydrolase [Phycisphaeraceae bacterium]
MKLVAGLGNPGRQYAETRHNLGYMVVDRLARRHDLTGVRTRFHAGVLDGTIAGERCALMQPVTFMNRSGLAVAEAVNFFKLDPGKDLLVVVDDLALPMGRIRFRATGGPGGHNGLVDVERALGTSDYGRQRIGIDASPAPGIQSDYVLGRFTSEQRAELPHVLDEACEGVECWLTEGIDAAMTRFNKPLSQ